jgi:four helix bundle protein
MANDMVIFTRAFDFLVWLLERTESFPRSQRFVVTQRLQQAALDFYERLFEANARRGTARLARLEAADEALGKVRHYLRLVTRLGWLTSGQYRHAAEMVAELGRLLGGWIRQTKGSRRQTGERAT